MSDFNEHDAGTRDADMPSEVSFPFNDHSVTADTTFSAYAEAEAAQRKHLDDEILAAYVSGESHSQEREAVRRHIAVCRVCRDAMIEAKQLRDMLRALRDASAPVGTTPSLANDVLALLSENVGRRNEWDTPAPPESVPASDKLPIRPELPATSVSWLDDEPQFTLDEQPGSELWRFSGRIGSRSSERATMECESSAERNAHAGTRWMTTLAEASANGKIDTPQKRARHTYSSIFVAVAAVVVFAVLAVAVFGVIAPNLRNSQVGGPFTPGYGYGHVSYGASTPVVTPITVNPHGVFAQVGLNSVQMLTASDGWAVGGTRTGSVIAHYDGARWTLVGPHLSGVSLTSVSMDGPTDGWAVGATIVTGAQQPTGVLAHYSNGVWTQAHMPVNGALVGVWMVSHDEGWAIGTANGSKFGSLLLRYHNGAWSDVSNTLWSVMGIAMTSASDGWIVGNNGSLGHYSGGQWARWSQSPSGTLNAISLLTPTDGWAVGSESRLQSDGDGRSVPFIMRFDGSSWSATEAPTVPYDSDLSGVSMDSATDGWAVGHVSFNTSPDAACLLLRYSHGRWALVPIQFSGSLNSVSMDSATDGWAVGVSTRNGLSAPVFLHYHNGAWHPYSA